MDTVRLTDVDGIVMSLHNPEVSVVQRTMLINEVPMFKIRAVRDVYNKWIPLVRRSNGELMDLEGKPKDTVTEAMSTALEMLKERLFNCIGPL